MDAGVPDGIFLLVPLGTAAPTIQAERSTKNKTTKRMELRVGLSVGGENPLLLDCGGLTPLFPEQLD